MIRSGYNHVGKTHPRNNSSWMNRAVRTAIKKRNRLRREVRTKRVEWLEACKEVQSLMSKAKQDAWMTTLQM